MRELNEEQRCAAESDADKLLVLAGAGTGKTFTMLQRISKLKFKGVDPSNILVLTFTNAAANEMECRYSRMCIDDKQRPFFGTFHSFCYSVICKYDNVRNKIGYKFVPDICPEDEYDKIKKSVILMYNIKLSKSMLTIDNPSISIKQKYEYTLFWKAVRKSLIQKNLISFDILCNDICKLFISDDECILPIKKRFEHVFVDEYQDTDKLQNDFVMSFTDSKIMVVGDALQNLYAFRGCTSEMIKNLSFDESWTTIKLTHNYRSTSQICTFANNATSYADPQYKIPIWSERQGSDISLISSGNSFQYCDVVNIVDRYNLCSPDQTTAILCRTNAECQQISKYFESNKLKSQIEDDILFLRSVSEDNFEQYLMSKISTIDYCNYLKSNWSGNYTSLMDYCASLKHMKSIFDKLNEVVESLNQSDGYGRILKIFNYPIADYDDKKSLLENCIDTIKQSSSEIYIGTVHSAKGLEYDNVILIQPGGQTWPLDNEDNLNLYYVGITRAKNNLYIVR